MRRTVTITLLGVLFFVWTVSLHAQKHEGGSFDGHAVAQSGVITLSGTPTSFAYTNPRFRGGSFDGHDVAASAVITLSGNPTAYAYTNPRFFGGSFDGYAAAQSPVITLSGGASEYTYLNPRFYGGSFDGHARVTSAVITLEGAEAEYRYVNPRFFGGNFSGFSTSRAQGPVTLSTPEQERTAPMPTAFALLQNYPNPFNPSTSIPFELPRETRVTLEVYDLLGRKVATLINGIKPAGRHAYMLSSSTLPFGSGVYFYRLQAGDFSQSRKMILLK